MNQISHLLALADAYQTALGIEDATVSSRVFDDGKKIAALRGGADITLGRFNAAVNWFARNWPDDASWPHEVPRPDIFLPAPSRESA